MAGAMPSVLGSAVGSRSATERSLRLQGLWTQFQHHAFDGCKDDEEHDLARSITMERQRMNAYRGPTLIKEPELRWPIVLLAASITALLAGLTAVLYYVAVLSAAYTL